MEEFYRFISEKYDKIGISDYSVTFGQSILKFFKMEHPERQYLKNLDICCGTGALCNFFEENGIKSKGVDISEDMLGIARKEYPDIEFIQADIVTYHDDDKYDFITCTDDAINHITDIDDLKRVFKNVNSFLNDGGYLFFDINKGNKLPNLIQREISNGERIELNFNVMDDNIVHTISRYYEKDELVGEHEDYGERIYTSDELFDLLNDSGFVVERCCQEFFDDKRHFKTKFIARKDELNLK